MGKDYNINSYYKEQYYFEVERKQSITNGLSIPLAIVSALGSLIFFLFDNLNSKFHIFKDLSIFNVVIIIFFSFALIFICLIIYNLYKAYFLNKEYSYVDKFKEIKEFESNLLYYYKNKYAGDLEKAELIAMKEIGENLESKFIEAIEINCTNNNSRTAYLADANQSLGILLIFTIFILIVYIFKSYLL